MEIRPWFITVPTDSADGAKARRPAMKSPVAIWLVVARKPPTSMLPLGPTSTPEGLTTKTIPLARKSPSITDGEPARTRFSTADEADGCRNSRDCPAARERLFQSSTARSECWCTVVASGEDLCTVALPAVTCGTLLWPRASLHASALVTAIAIGPLARLKSIWFICIPQNL